MFNFKDGFNCEEEKYKVSSTSFIVKDTGVRTNYTLAESCYSVNVYHHHVVSARGVVFCGMTYSVRKRISHFKYIHVHVD